MSVPTDEQIETALSDGEISEDNLNNLLDGNVEPETGDKTGEEPTPEPEVSADSTTETEEDSTEEKEPVLMAKDGIHTIPYQKLADARDEAKSAKEMVAHWQQIAEAKGLINTPETVEAEAEQTEAEAAMTESMEELLADYPEAAGQIKQLMESNKDLSNKLTELGSNFEKAQTSNAKDLHFNDIQNAHPDYLQVMDDKFLAWVDTQPSFIRDSYKDVYEQGSSEQVIEMIDTYKQSTKQSEPAPDVSQKVADAQNANLAPTSLSEVPGSSAPQDENEAMRNMTTNNLLDKFEGNSVEQVEAMLERVL